MERENSSFDEKAVRVSFELIGRLYSFENGKTGS